MCYTAVLLLFILYIYRYILGYSWLKLNTLSSVFYTLQQFTNKLQILLIKETTHYFFLCGLFMKQSITRYSSYGQPHLILSL